MVQALDVTFDRPSEARVRAAWEELRDAGLPSLARHTAPSNRPHLTLDSRDAVPAAAEAGLAVVAARLPLEVRIGSLVLFRARQRWVVARHVVVDRPLLELHEHVHAVLGPGGSPLTLPGQWVPHLTLARGVTDDDLPRALALAGAAPPFTATALRLRRWDDEAGEAWDVHAVEGQTPSERSL
ncbi:2'-5' RNA ligase family protein [Nocardioides coralli]|uniref:2'-5' RNA ligase family protein n=1 Tax=Nocardioides coralli TaxID=2872154 RepID=UPI001CA38E19|nr:2'-5' RNA ligase family protein [Nocardioides coralli]QZY30083.1 2'-5' RNA ligase family protein [Nocardioides coralli]